MDNSNNYFNIKRFYFFVRKELVCHNKTILNYIATIFCVLLLYCIIVPEKTYEINFHTSVFALLLLFGGCWLSSLAFREAHDSREGSEFLLLPSSSLEKFVGKLLLTTICYFTIISTIFFCISSIAVILYKTLFHYEQPLFNVFTATIGKYFWLYVVLQSIVLFGSIKFKKNVLSKVVLITCVFIMLLMLLFLIYSLIFIGPKVYFSIDWNYPIIKIANFIFWYLLAPACWFMTYIKLKNKEL